MFHVENFINLVRNIKNKNKLERLKVREIKFAAVVKKHVTSSEIESHTMKEIVKEEKDQGFKRQNCHYKLWKKEFF
jgi:hypothetical protein